MNANLHAGPLICLSLDLAYNSFAFNIRHVWITIAFGLVYMFINLSKTSYNDSLFFGSAYNISSY